MARAIHCDDCGKPLSYWSSDEIPLCDCVEEAPIPPKPEDAIELVRLTKRLDKFLRRN